MSGQMNSTLCSTHLVKEKFCISFVLWTTLGTFSRAACTFQLVFTVLKLRQFSRAQSSIAGDPLSVENQAHLKDGNQRTPRQ